MSKVPFVPLGSSNSLG